MKLLVTGGLGFIGSSFIRYMLTKHSDIQIINLDKLSIGSNPANLKSTETYKRYKFIKGDIADKKLVNNLVSKADIVVNIAAETHVDRSIAEPSPFLNSNTIGAVTLFEATRKHKKRLLHVSTDEVYGDILEGSFKEDDELKPSSPYSASKAAADLFAQAYHRTYDLNVVIARCTNNYGPYQFPEKLIPKTIIRASLELPIPVYGKGQNIRDWIYVQDFCEALEVLLNEGRNGEIYNISASNELANIDIAKMILKFMGKPVNTVTFVEDRPGHDLRYSLDSSKIRNELGWRPRHGFQEALEATVNWYMNNEWWWKPLITEQVLHPTPWKLKW
ncbi:MAG: dTDP-glucose 4,6-dehydratase [Candidatus Bathyarchaeota archaeon]|nr:dTDP-glucose 4,6-dehydratase [Candidatus Bathyarchaeota archaeon]